MINLVLLYLRTVTISVVHIHTALCDALDEDHWSKRRAQLLLIDVYIARITRFSTHKTVIRSGCEKSGPIAIVIRSIFFMFVLRVKESSGSCQLYARR